MLSCSVVAPPTLASSCGTVVSCDSCKTITTRLHLRIYLCEKCTLEKYHEDWKQSLRVGVLPNISYMLVYMCNPMPKGMVFELFLFELGYRF